MFDWILLHYLRTVFLRIRIETQRANTPNQMQLQTSHEAAIATHLNIFNIFFQTLLRCSIVVVTKIQQLDTRHRGIDCV